MLIKKAKNKPKHKEDAREIYVATGQAVMKIHACKRTYHIPLSMREELIVFTQILSG